MASFADSVTALFAWLSDSESSDDDVRSLVASQSRLLYSSCDCEVAKYPLHAAAAYGRYNLMKHFLALAPDLVDTVNKKGQTTMHLLIENFNEQLSAGEQIRLLKFLLEKQESKALTIADAKGRTPLHLVSLYAKAGTVGYLMEQLEDLPLEKDEDGLTPFHAAVRAGRHDVVEVFLEYSDEFVSVCDNKNCSPFLSACLVDLRMTKLIWGITDVYLNFKDAEGMSPLLAMLNGGCLEVAAFLMKHRALPVDDEKLTADGRKTLEHATRLVRSKIEESNKRHRSSSSSDEDDEEEEEKEERSVRQCRVK